MFNTRYISRKRVQIASISSKTPKQTSAKIYANRKSILAYLPYFCKQKLDYTMTIAEIQKECIATLKRGGLILYPTDTVWGIGCDATNAQAIDRVYALKKRADNKALITLVSDYDMLRQFVEEVPQVAYDVLNFADSPTTIIYDDPIRVASNLVASDNTLAIRVIKENFCNRMVKKYRKPIVSTSANISGQPTPKNFSEISEEIKDGVDFIVPIEQNSKKKAKPSVIIKISNSGEVKVIRN